MSAKVAPEPTEPEGETTSKNDPETQESPRLSPRPSPRDEMADQGLFGFKDPKTIKDQVKRCLEKQEPYSVFMYYKDDSESMWPRLAKAPLFENATLAVIAFNAVYISIDTDWNKEEPLTPTNTFSLTESGAFFQCMEHFFCVYFTFEWVTRFMAFRIKRNGLKDGWFVFDSLLVFMMVMETWVMLIVMAAIGGGSSPIGGTSVLRLFGLLRLSRLMKMLRSLPELMILIKGMATAMKSVAYVMGLLVLITYVFAIAFTQLAVGQQCGDDYFANVAHSMYSLFIYATFLDDLSAFTDALRFENPPLLVVTFIFIPLAALTVMNMLIGVLCEVVSAVADRERDEIRTENLSTSMRAVVSSLDTNNNNSISYKEFTEIMGKQDSLTALDDVGVNPVSMVDFAELFFFEDDQPIELSFEDFMEKLLELRESNTATVKDMLNLWMKIKTSTNKEIGETKKLVVDLTENVNERTQKLDAQQDRIDGSLAAALAEVRKLTSKIPDV